MIYVNDDLYDSDYFEQCYHQFDQHPVLKSAKGKRITVCLSDTALWIALCLYARANGISVFPLPADTPEEAIRRRAQLSASHYLINASDMDGLFTGIEQVSDHEDDLAPVLVQMSSGTTGEPKCIDRTWASIDVELENYVAHFTELEGMTTVVACPVNHSYGLICGVLATLTRGAVPVIINNFNPKYIIRKLAEAEKPILYSSPALIMTITMMVKEDQPIHAIMTSGTLMQATWLQQAKKKCLHLFQQYGCSEVGCISLGGNIDSVHDMGIQLPHITVTTGKSEKEPEEIRVSVKNGESVATRDLGYIDSNWRLHFLSRIDEMINVAGLNVYPAEVEKVVMSMPDVLDAVVFKKAHAFGNDQVCLQFVSNKAIQTELIRSWCLKYLNKYQVPLNITQVEKIDRLPNGKVSRKKLSEASA